MTDVGGTARVFDPDVSEWDAWRPEQVARILADVKVPWYVAGGWAIDLFLGGQRREHGDLEIAIPSNCFGEIAEALEGLEICVITGSNEAMLLADAGDRLASTHQTWLREPATGRWRIDVFREPSDDDTWIFRRDERIRLPFDQAIERTAEGIPFGRPEIILLYKAKHSHKEKDQGDFAAVLPELGQERRRWLADALELVHPGHGWIGELG
jgi:aminoglycoside-2''-adenylyltransferase